MAPLVSRLFTSHSSKRKSQISQDAEAVSKLLRQYGYFAAGPLDWQQIQKQVDLSFRITNHAEVERHTYYHLECSIKWSEEDGTHSMHAWSVERRLQNFRSALHDPVKRQLASSYAELFNGARFAHTGGPRGTTKRLNRWLHRLAHCMNARILPPVMVALILTVLDAPGMPKHELSSRNMVSASSSPKAATDISSRDGVGNCGWSDIGLSDDDSDDETCGGDSISVSQGVASFSMETPREKAHEFSSAKSGQAVDTSAIDSTSTATSEDWEQHINDGESSSIEGDVHPSSHEGNIAAGEPLEASSPSSSCSYSASREILSLEVAQSHAVEHAISARHSASGGLKSCGVDESSIPDAPIDLKKTSSSGPAESDALHESGCKGFMQLRPLHVEESAQIASESKFQAKLRARKEIVDLQKMSGRGELF